MQINDELIEYLEGLSKLSLNADERSRISSQLQELLTYMDMLSELETNGETAPASFEKSAGFLRADEVKPSRPVDEILANAPKRQENYFSVPKARD